MLGSYWGPTAFRALCTFWVFQNTNCRCISKFSPFLSMITSNLIRKRPKRETKNENEKCSNDGCPNDGDNSKNHQAIWYVIFSSSGGYSKELLHFLEHNRRAKSDKFQSQSFVMLSLQGWAQNGISRFGPTTWTWHCCYNDITAISQNIGEKLDFNFTKSG